MQLQKQITLITDEPYQYDLRTCTLHHGADLYMSLIFEKDDVVEVNDTLVKCITNEWENRSTSTGESCILLEKTKPYVIQTRHSLKTY